MVRSGSGGKPPEISESDDLGDPTAAVDGLFFGAAGDAATEAADEPEDSAAAPAGRNPAAEPLPERERAFGRYTLLRRLAYGGMGEVFLARQGGAGSLAQVAKLVVIKRILGHMRRDDRHRRMFLDEARLQALLNNPQVVQIFDMGEEDGHVYLAMEHVLGPSWRAIIDRVRRLRQHIPVAYVCAMVAQAARGLSYAHNLVDVSGAPLKIVHRDINPLNVLVSYDGEVKIIDFGIAKSELQEGNTETGTIKGKFNYMSPEQSAAKKLDHRSDIFTLGICLQELLTNENPFRRPNVVLSLEAIQKDAPVRLARRRPEAGLLQPILDRCLAKDAEERFADAIFVADELDELVASGAVPAPAEPLSVWLRRVFADEIADHMRILEETGSARAMVRRDDTSQRFRAAPRTAPVAAAADLSNQATKVTDSPLLDEPSFEVDSMSGDYEGDLSLTELPEEEEGTAATPSGMSLASLSSPPPSGFDPFADVARPAMGGPITAVEEAPELGSLEPAAEGDVFELEPSPRRSTRPALLAAAAILGLATVAAAILLWPKDSPAEALGEAEPASNAKVDPAAAPGTDPGATKPPPGADAAAASDPAPVTDPPAVSPEAPDRPATPEPPAAVPPVPDAPAPAADTPEPPARPERERTPRKRRSEERTAVAAAPVLGSVAVSGEGLTIKGRRKVTQGELSTLAVSGGPFELRLSVRANTGDTAVLTVESEPWALVQVDSMGRGKTPLGGIALPPGKRVVLTLKSPKAPQPMNVSVTWTPSGG